MPVPPVVTVVVAVVVGAAVIGRLWHWQWQHWHAGAARLSCHPWLPAWQWHQQHWHAGAHQQTVLPFAAAFSVHELCGVLQVPRQQQQLLPRLRSNAAAIVAAPLLEVLLLVLLPEVGMGSATVLPATAKGAVFGVVLVLLLLLLLEAEVVQEEQRVPRLREELQVEPQ